MLDQDVARIDLTTVTAADGKRIKDRYSLFGFTDAHKSIGKACNAR